MDFIPKNLLIHFEDFSTKRYGADSCGILRSPWGRVRLRYIGIDHETNK